MKLLQELCDITAPSGHETALHELIQSEIKDCVDEITTDALGNLIAHKKGPGKRLMLAAHTDEIGLIVTYIEESGYIRVQNIGGVRPQYALAQRVRFLNGTVGVVFYDQGKEIEKLGINDLYVDIGAKNKEEAAKLVQIGDVAGFLGEFTEQNGCVISKSLDDRAGCYVLIEALKRVKDTPNDVYAVFTAQEELGLRGATAGAYSVDPDLGIAIDVTDTGDMIGTTPMEVKLGGGAAIKIKDSRSISSPKAVGLLKSTAKAHGIPYQLEVLTRGGTDAGAIHLTRGGVASVTLSIPTRYIHSPGEMVCKDDLEACIDLLAAVIEEQLD
ncbi:MAG TPA: M42 family metallopeptidase [Candidatus Aphodoplasma excrementigallinarum]|uniref:M42 family metallopeptidase n=1 Tax=Candidatus Aphodoplasma excrementigallinarum TaxID=2840673 RepID=A0A9D1NGJ9_9FIRM|nr:M42 family metallopeptidase [Candidatus Aphodoplasma excrementigallinarum]